jgi:(2Fe-2S) ferredoxin
MTRPKKHVFVCSQNRPPHHPRGSCAGKNSDEVLHAFWAELERRQIQNVIAVSRTSCIGPCQQGPTVLVYPEAVLYCGVKEADVAEIFERHLLGEEPVTRLQAPAELW